jgi:hypothetical protein
MPKFAVYYVPPADSALYQHGSDILGYDVRAGEMLPTDNATRAALPEFDEAWIQQPQTYGFHITTGYSLYFDWNVLPQIEAEMEHVCALFGRDVRFQLNPATEPVPFWRDEIVVLHYDPNPAMLMLHTMLTARVNPYGTGSNVSQRYAQQSPETLDPVLAKRVERYYTPYMLDGWSPHFTLMMPYRGTQPYAMRNALMKLFPPEPVTVESISLLVRDDDEPHYRFHREFALFS